MHTFTLYDHPVAIATLHRTDGNPLRRRIQQGTGSFAKVKLVTTADKVQYALKIVDKSKLKPSELENLGVRRGTRLYACKPVGNRKLTHTLRGTLN